jgi:hypothetical protein
MADTEHEIKVTLRDVYEKVEKQAEVIGSISAKLDLYIGLTERLTDHEKRIRTMERWVFALPGVAAIMSVAGLVVAVLKT